MILYTTIEASVDSPDQATAKQRQKHTHDLNKKKMSQ